jgi:rhodanese-related sulfurtransferase
MVKAPAGFTIAILLGYVAYLGLGAAASPPERGASIGTIGVGELCQRIRDGKPIVFVDVREPAEFAEEHLPRAVSLPARDMPEEFAEVIDTDATVIPYCLKDFRGFEGARRLRELGVRDVRLLAGVGIEGWKAEALPTAGRLAPLDDEGGWNALLARCEERLR